MKICVIRVVEMAVERVGVLRQLMGAGNLVQELFEHEVSEEQLLDPGFMDKNTLAIQDADVLFVAMPGAYASHIARASLRLGVHTFLGRSAAPSISEYKLIASLSEEAGVEAGVSRITRFYPFLHILPHDWRPQAITLQHDNPRWDPMGFQQMIEDAVDLCCNLAGSSEVRRVEAQQVQHDKKSPECLIVGLRFQNGAYAQMQLRQGAATARHEVYAGVTGLSYTLNLLTNTLHIRNSHTRNSNEAENDSDAFALEGQSLPECNLIEQETIAFLNAIANLQPAPVSITDGLQTRLLVEKIRKNLR